MDDAAKRHLEDLIARYPRLEGVKKDIGAAYESLEDCFLCGGKASNRRKRGICGGRRAYGRRADEALSQAPPGERGFCPPPEL